MKLDIIIPHYHEDESVVKPLLSSIAIQQGIDFNNINVYIINDGNDVILSDDFLKPYKEVYKIKYIINDHGGISITRNKGYDCGTGDYVMYCDCDDMFYSATALHMIFEEMANGFDVLSSYFLEEVCIGKKFLYVKHEHDYTFVHGKVFNRKYLDKWNIRFCDELKINEDCYFICLAQRIADVHKYCKEPFYLWKYRKGSVSRDDLFVLKTYPDLIKTTKKLADGFKERGYTKEAGMVVCNLVFETYYHLQLTCWQGHPELLAKCKESYTQFFKDYWNYVNKYMTQEMIQENIIECRRKMARQGLGSIKITFEDFIKELGIEEK